MVVGQSKRKTTSTIQLVFQIGEVAQDLFRADILYLSKIRGLKMSMAKQIFYHNLRKNNNTEVEIYERDIKPYYEKERKRKLLLIIRFLNLLHKLEREL